MGVRGGVLRIWDSDSLTSIGPGGEPQPIINVCAGAEKAADADGTVGAVSSRCAVVAVSSSGGRPAGRLCGGGPGWRESLLPLGNILGQGGLSSHYPS